MNKLLLALLMSFTLLISACGGGSGGGFGEQETAIDGGTDPDVDPDDETPGDDVVSVSVGNGVGGSFVDGQIGIASNILAQNESTTLIVTIVDQAGSQVTAAVTGTVSVQFLSPCIASGKATLTTDAIIQTTSGQAQTTYTATGCSGNDQITATVTSAGAPGGVTVSDVAVGTVGVDAPVAFSIQNVAGTTQVIDLAGTGGATTADLQFKVVTAGGNPVEDVRINFVLEGASGGASVFPLTQLSGADGLVTTTISAGSVQGSVTVKATIDGTAPEVSISSKQLWIGTGLPRQAGFSLSAGTFNIEGWNYDGETTSLSVILSDRWGNPVSEGTTVTFTSEGSQIESGCATEYVTNEDSSSTSSACSVTFTSADFRPSDGRINILATAKGEETYFDLNGNGRYDDADGPHQNLGEMFVDYDEDGTHNAATEPFFDGNENGGRDADNDILEGGNRFNGALCEASNCSADTTTLIGKNITIVLSGSNPVFSSPQLNGGAVNFGIDPSFDIGSGTRSIQFDIVDVNGNVMPAGTTVALSVTNGKIGSATSYTVLSTTEAYTFGFLLEAVIDDKTSGTGTITVTTPRGVITSNYFEVVDDALVP